MVIAMGPVPELVRELLWVIVVPAMEMPEFPLVEMGELSVVVPELAFCVTEAADVVG